MLKDVLELREGMGLSQEKFAAYFNIPVSTIRSWEQGQRRPPDYVLEMMDYIAAISESHALDMDSVLNSILTERYGKDDVVRNYVSDKYPLGCSFYVKSRDLYIEDFTSPVHMGRWFNDSYTNMEALRELQDDMEERPYHETVVNIWAGMDVEKREDAEKNELNYVVFWDPFLDDLYDWIAAGFPDGRDWEDDGHTWVQFDAVDKSLGEPTGERKGADGFDFSEANRPEEDPYSHEVSQTVTWYESKNKDELLKRLRQKFGVDDVVDGYSSEKYPFASAIYIRSRDLYIELHDFANHGGHWFREGSKSDRAKYNKWQKMGDMDDNMITCCMLWRCVDVWKRWYAGHYGLNYVVFWKPNGMDMKKWFDMGCPDGQDWYKERSWMDSEEPVQEG